MPQVTWMVLEQARRGRGGGGGGELGLEPGQSCPESVPLTTVLSCSMREVTAPWGPGVPSPPSESAPFPVTTCHRRREAPQKPAVLGTGGDKCVCACVLVIVCVTGSHTSILVSACQGHDGAGFGVTCDVSLASISLCWMCLSVTVSSLSLFVFCPCISCWPVLVP